jgi:TolB-like protein/DNA-binding SARP family transcriptional activator
MTGQPQPNLSEAHGEVHALGDGRLHGQEPLDRLLLAASRHDCRWNQGGPGRLPKGLTELRLATGTEALIICLHRRISCFSSQPAVRGCLSMAYFYAPRGIGPWGTAGKQREDGDSAVESAGKSELILSGRRVPRRPESGTGGIAMAVAELTLFGGLEVRLASGELVDLPGQKDRALLAVLALPPGATHSREKLAGLLWSDRGDEQARDSLKHSLTRLRQCFPSVAASPIVADRQSVRLDPAAVTSDTAAFERLVSEATADSLERATALYRGDLLDGIGIRDPAFEDWLLVERQRLRNLVEDALSRLLEQSMTSGARERAAVAARRLLSLDPLRESASRALMQIHAESSQTSQALKVYETLRDRLHRELGVKPERETIQLYESIRQRRSAAEAPAAGAPYKVAGGREAAPGPVPESTIAPALPSKPSIAVLPFQNLSGDPEQEYFADGIVEEIITALSRMRWLFVIARNSSFSYRGRAVDVKQIGRELGVRYLLEGSVRKAANRVRIAGQLIDASTGAHLWADRFEGQLEDIFDLQDQMTTSVVGAIAPKLEQAEIERSRSKPTDNLDAYDYFLRGMSAVHQWTKEANIEAIKMFTRAADLDPNFASTYGMLSRCYSQRRAGGWVTDRARDIVETERVARKAAALGADDAVALCTAGIGLAFVVGETDDGIALIDRALVLNPNLAMAWLFSGWVNVWLGEPDLAVANLAHAMRLSPNDPQIAMMQAATACAHFFAGRIAEATTWAERSVRLQPNYFIASCVLAASSALDSHLEEAAKAIARLRQIDPGLRISNLLDSFPIRRQEDFARWADGLRKAGLPE